MGSGGAARWKNAVTRVGIHFHDRATEWLLALVTASWGLIYLSSDPSLWQAPSLQPLARIGGQELWGIVAFTLGVTRLAALFINGSQRKSPHARAICAFFSCLIWFQLTLGLLVSLPQPLALAVYPWLFATDTYNVWRASRDARRSDSVRVSARALEYAERA